MKSNIVKFISWDHVFVVAMCAFVMYMLSLNPANGIRFVDWLLMYGVMLANVRAIKSTT
jgi:hypothetical protein